MTLQDTLAITYQNASTKDKLRVVFGAMLKNLVGSAEYASLINTNYSDNPVKGGSVHIDRMAFATVRDYLTAHGAGKGDTPQNNGIDILVNVDKEIITEVPKKDARLWREGGEAEMLAVTKDAQVEALKIFLDSTYFVALQTAAQVFDASAYATVPEKVLALIRKAEGITGDNINKIDRSQLVVTLDAVHFDAMETYMTTLANTEGNSKRMFHEVEMRKALRQGVDAVIQVRGAMGMPMVLDNYSVSKPSYKNALVQELYFSYGIGAVMPEAIFKCALTGDISV